MRLLFRSRWAALFWAASICLTAAHFAQDQPGAMIDAANSADGKAAQANAVAAGEE